MTTDSAQDFHTALTLMGRGGPTFYEGLAMADKLAAHFPPAMAHRAAMAVMGYEAGVDAADLFTRAALSGFPPALRGLAVILLETTGLAEEGAFIMSRAAAAGDGMAQIFAKELPVKTVEIDPDLCRRAVAGAIARNDFPSVGRLYPDPVIEVREGLLSPGQCRYVILSSQRLLQPSKVTDGAKAAGAGYRTSDGAVIGPAHMDFILALIVTRLSRVAGIDPLNGELLSVLRYRPGEEYKPHHDYLPQDAKDYSMVKRCGQRQATLLTYLNADYEGGETEFPDIHVTYKGRTGDGLYFRNTHPKTGEVLPKSLHAGRPVTSGEKYLATLWCREKRFWP